MTAGLALAFLAGCATPHQEKARPSDKTDIGTKFTLAKGVHFAGGNGSTLEQAVIVLGAESDVSGVAAEFSWLLQHYPGFQMLDQSLINQGSKNYDVLKFVTPDDQHHVVYFDITDYFSKTLKLSGTP